MTYGSDLGSIYYIQYIHEPRKKSGRELQEYISAHWNQLFDFLLLDKANMVNDDSEWKWWWFCMLEFNVYIAGAVDCGVHIILRIHCKSLEKVVIFRPA
jgi:hypothetical protein